jgi:hypothetical protein
MSTVPRAGLRLRFLSDPGDFLAVAGDYLSADPVVSTVVTTIAQVCLFTDQANPTSNKIYAALGYRPVVDMANLVIV